jgi:hypothetical protein
LKLLSSAAYWEVLRCFAMTVVVPGVMPLRVNGLQFNKHVISERPVGPGVGGINNRPGRLWPQIFPDGHRPEGFFRDAKINGTRWGWGG